MPEEGVVSESVRRLALAAESAIVRCEDVLACAEDPTARLSTLFSLREIGITSDVCMGFLMAVAETESTADFTAIRELLERLRDKTMEANAVVAQRVADNPYMMTGITGCFETMFRLMLAGNPMIRVVAGLLKGFPWVMRSVLMAVFTDLRQQLESHEGLRMGRDARMQSLLFRSLEERFGACLVSTVGRYAEETKREIRMTRKDVLRAYRSGDDVLGTLTGPRQAEKRDQVRAVVTAMAASKRPLSISEACRTTFQPIEGGYSTVHELYVWCHRNEDKVLRLVDDCRMQGGGWKA